MTTINDTYINALLVDASYLNGMLPNQTGTALATLLAGRMTPNSPNTSATTSLS